MRRPYAPLTEEGLIERMVVGVFDGGTAGRHESGRTSEASTSSSETAPGVSACVTIWFTLYRAKLLLPFCPCTRDRFRVRLSLPDKVCSLPRRKRLDLGQILAEFARSLLPMIPIPRDPAAVRLPGKVVLEDIACEPGASPQLRSERA